MNGKPLSDIQVFGTKALPFATVRKQIMMLSLYED